MASGRLYIGHRRGMAPELFRAAEQPTESTHGRIYFAVTGPFRTRRAAEIMAAQWPGGNPCFSTVADCERFARLEKQSQKLAEQMRPQERRTK